MDYLKLENEIRYRFSRASGNGGQHVNKVETRVDLLFDIDASACFSEEEKERVRSRLSGRINREGQLLITVEKYRSQHRNRKEALRRFFEEIETALQPDTPRTGHVAKKAKPGLRLKKKKAQSQKKALRRKGASLLDPKPLPA